MQFASLIPLTVMLFWFYFLYESPRWQITNGQVDRAEQTLKNALKMNGKSDDNLKTQLSELSAYLQKVYKFFLNDSKDNTLYLKTIIMS